MKNNKGMLFMFENQERSNRNIYNTQLKLWINCACRARIETANHCCLIKNQIKQDRIAITRPGTFF
jgi:hypothetical protein